MLVAYHCRHEKKHLDLYMDYLISIADSAAATGLSAMLEGVRIKLCPK